MHLLKIAQPLGALGANGWLREAFIETVPRRGYRGVAPLETQNSAHTGASGIRSGIAAGLTQPSFRVNLCSYSSASHCVIHDQDQHSPNHSNKKAI